MSYLRTYPGQKITELCGAALCYSSTTISLHDVVTVWPFSCFPPGGLLFEHVIAVSKHSLRRLSLALERQYWWCEDCGHVTQAGRKCVQVLSVASARLPHFELICVMFECHYVRSNKAVIIYSSLVKEDPRFPYFREKSSTQIENHTRLNIMRNAIWPGTIQYHKTVYSTE